MDDAMGSETEHGVSLAAGRLFSWSTHADRQVARRGIAAAAIAHCLRWGLVIHQNGASVHYLATRRAPEGTPERWLGVAVVLSRDGRVITAFKRRDGLPRRLRRRSHPAFPYV